MMDRTNFPELAAGPLLLRVGLRFFITSALMDGAPWGFCRGKKQVQYLITTTKIWESTHEE